MSLKVRSVLVLVIGTVLGLTVSIGSSMLAERPVSAEAVRQVPDDPGLALLAEALERVRREYVDRIDDETLVRNAIQGMLEGLDKHSGYLDHDKYEEIRIATTGNYTGIGLDVKLRDGQVVVETPIVDAPAYLAGIRAGDVLVAVDDIPVGRSGLPVENDELQAAIGRMRGEAGTEVRLSVSRGSQDDVLDFALTRAAIHVNTVTSEYLPGGYGYLRLSGFSESTVDEINSAAEELFGGSERELRGLVLDLRDNPGGVLQAAIGVADVFLDDGLIVRGNGRIRQSRFAEYAQPGDVFETVPLAVLINRNSASGSEIVAGALKDHGRAELIGERSYGKGSVQSVVPLGSDAALKLTTAHYVTPSGATINGRGVEPDIVVRFDAGMGRQYDGQAGEVEIAKDPQLSRALESLGYRAISLSQAR